MKRKQKCKLKWILTWSGDWGGCGDGLQGAPVCCCCGPGLCGGGAWGDWAGGGPKLPGWGPGLAAGEGHCWKQNTLILHEIESEWRISLESRVADGFAGPTIAVVLDSLAVWDIFEDIDTAEVALEDQAVDLIAAELTPGSYLGKTSLIWSRTLTRWRIRRLPTRWICLE